MTRFFTQERLAPDVSDVRLCGTDARHARDVLRMKPGDRFILCDGAMRDHECVVATLSREEIRADVVFVSDNTAEPVYEAILYQGLPKGDKMEDIVRKSVELGVSRIVPVSCARSVARWDPGDSGAAARLERWNRIAREAARQCGRGRVPEVLAPMELLQAFREASSADLAFLPWENERDSAVRPLLEDFRPAMVHGFPSRASIAFFIGPEGGFDAAEAAHAVGLGIRTVSLGRRILRTETAGPAVLAMLTCLLDEFRVGMGYN
jgi:16S rRNA (uracil1498-N3)-methyltransferase